MAILRKLTTLLGNSARDEAAKKPAPRTPPKSAAPVNPYGAVSITPGIRSCPAARAGVGKPHLFREAPRLPLPDCTLPAQCSCRFKKVADRRAGDRRQLGVSETGRWFAGEEKRQVGRRKSRKQT